MFLVVVMFDINMVWHQICLIPIKHLRIGRFNMLRERNRLDTHENEVIQVKENNSRHSREIGNPVYFGFTGCNDSLDYRLIKKDGDGV